MLWPTWKHGSILTRANCSGWLRWCEAVGVIFMAHLGLLVPTENCFYITAYLSTVSNHVHPLMTTSSKIISDWSYCTPLASTVTRSQSHRTSLGSGRMGDWHHWCVTLWCFHVNMDQNAVDVSITLLNLCHNGCRQFWRHEGAEPCTNRLYLIKCHSLTF